MANADTLTKITTAITPAKQRIGKSYNGLTELECGPSLLTFYNYVREFYLKEKAHASE